MIFLKTLLIRGFVKFDFGYKAKMLNANIKIFYFPKSV